MCFTGFALRKATNGKDAVFYLFIYLFVSLCIQLHGQGLQGELRNLLLLRVLGWRDEMLGIEDADGSS